MSDYAKFAESISGDATGEICRVMIAGEEVLVAKRGAYAMLMNVEHRPTMEALLAAEPKPSDAAQPLAEWLAANDFAVVLTRAGVEALTALGSEAVAQQQAAMKEQLGDPQLGGGLEDDARALGFVESVLGFSASEVQTVGMGVAIDDDANLRISNRMAFIPDGTVAKPGGVKALDASPLAGYPAEPFVVAAGGPVPQRMDRPSRPRRPPRNGRICRRVWLPGLRRDPMAEGRRLVEGQLPRGPQLLLRFVRW